MKSASAPFTIAYSTIIPLRIVEWTILCGLVYLAIRLDSRRIEPSERFRLLVKSIVVLVVWVVPTVLLALIDYQNFPSAAHFFQSPNLISVLVVLQLLIIILDIIRQHRRPVL
jgi:cytochrome bd-type quinol oxidase subunit 2